MTMSSLRELCQSHVNIKFFKFSNSVVSSHSSFLSHHKLNKGLWILLLLLLQYQHLCQGIALYVQKEVSYLNFSYPDGSVILTPNIQYSKGK